MCPTYDGRAPLPSVMHRTKRGDGFTLALTVARFPRHQQDGPIMSRSLAVLAAATAAIRSGRRRRDSIVWGATELSTVWRILP